LLHDLILISIQIIFSQETRFDLIILISIEYLLFKFNF